MIEIKSAKGWKPSRRGYGETYEVFTSPKGIDYVRCHPNEDPDAVYRSHVKGLPDMFLKLADSSRTVKKSERRERRKKRELRARGYDV